MAIVCAAESSQSAKAQEVALRALVPSSAYCVGAAGAVVVLVFGAAAGAVVVLVFVGAGAGAVVVPVFVGAGAGAVVVPVLGAGAGVVVPVYLQAWIADPAGPQGYAASNGLRANIL